MTYNDSNGNTQTTSEIMGSWFCNTVGNGYKTNNCTQNPRSGFSAQSYYRNLFIRSDKLGNINSTNQFYDCPQVYEPLKFNGGSYIYPSPTPAPNYWPLDTSFALAMDYSTDWSVGVDSGSILYKAGDPNSVTSFCTQSAPGAAQYAGINEGQAVVHQCLGYAKVPKPDGTCGTITDNNGGIRPLTRLRRFRVIYPPVYDASGNPLKGANPADEVYIADRLVVDHGGNLTGNMTYGPKPCNFSWFDHEGVVNRDGTFDMGSSLQHGTGAGGLGVLPRPSYVSTINYQHLTAANQSLPLNPESFPNPGSVNPDGVIYPDQDLNPTSALSCSATLPLIERVMGHITSLKLMTTNKTRTDYLDFGTQRVYLNEIAVQPVTAWVPNYVEDTSFKACVPLADPYLDPPLHFYKGASGKTEWCAEAYPTQNPYWVNLNSLKKPTGTQLSTIVADYGALGAPGSSRVKTYTSHHSNVGAAPAQSLDTLSNSVWSNTCAGTNSTQICKATLGTVGAPFGTNWTDCANYLNALTPTYLDYSIGAGANAHKNTCDRTVTFDENQAFQGFPLLAEDVDIDKMLSQDDLGKGSFACTYSVNPDATKIGTATPASGCCGMVGVTPLLNALSAAGKSGHLEPYHSPTMPGNIRFCGDPVQ